MEKLRNTKTLGVIGNILIIISLFCTWAVVGSESTGIKTTETFIHTKDGAVALILAIISLINIFAENISPKFFKGLTNVKLTYISTIIQLLIVVNVLHGRLSISNTDKDIYVHFGLGFYLMCIGIVLLLVFPILYKKNNKEEKNINL